MGFEKAGSVSDVPEGNLTEMTIGDRPLAVCRVNGEIHVIEGTCPHRGGPLGYGALHGTTVVCPWHAWEFDCTTGRATFSEHLRIRKFDVKVEEGDILVDLE